MDINKINNLDQVDLKETAIYFLKSFIYSLLLGSAVIAIGKNYKKAMLNEEAFAAYKFFKKMQQEGNAK